MTGGNLWQAFTRVADAYPDHEAFCGPDSVLSYRQLATAAGALADRLTARDVGVGDVVAIASPVGPGFIAGMLAATAVGAAYLPMDITGPAKRRAAILEQARPAAVLSDDDVPTTAGAPARRAPATGGEDPAYVIYTSGSTGAPKGVVVPARGVHNLVSAFQRRAPVGRGARHSWWTSPGFDVSVYEIWSALSAGGSVVPVPEAHRRDVDATLDYLAERRVESAYLPPQFLQALRERMRRGGAVPPLRRLLTGVEPIPIGLLVELRAGIPGVVLNGYGPTETTVVATLYTVPDHCEDPQRRTPIGPVIEGDRGFVLDERLTPVGPGQPGELFVAGTGVALGYLHDPQRTSERFLPAIDGDGLMYRTGDIVVGDEDGELTFLGRVDDQLKVDGVRIEPAETEAVLRRLPEISDVAVLAWPATPGGPAVLTAFVVLSAKADAGDQAWTVPRERLAEELPAQAVPRRVWVLDRIPMTPDGKLDRAALPRPDDRPARAPRGEYERAVVDACRTVLPQPPAAVLDLGFAEMGGDSLGATRLSLALRASTGRAVTAADVLAATTMADLSAELAALPATAADDDEQELGPAPLTPGQLGMWAAELTGSSPGAFHEMVAVELTGSVEAPRIAAELAAVLNRHVIFRGRIDEDGLRLVTDGEPVRVTTRSVAPGEDLGEAWRALVDELQRPAFDFDRGPLVRAAVLAGPDAARVLVVWHHLAVDAWSARVVLEELAAALNGTRPGPVERGHVAYALRQARYLASPEGKEAVRAAADRVRAWLPERAPDAAEELGTCRVRELTVGPRVWSGVRECARRNGTTMFPVVLAGILDPLCRLAETQGRFALAVADRDEIADADAAGYFLTTVPFRLRFDDERDEPAALRRAREFIAEAHAMSRVPFPSLMAELGLRDTRPVAPLVIAWDRDVTSGLTVPGAAVRTLPVSPLGSRWPWTVLLTDRADHGMSGRIEFPPWAAADQVALFGSRIESMLDVFTSRV